MEHSTHALRILLVEDDDNARGATTRLLQQHGYSVVAAEDCESAYRCAKSEHFDLLIADMRLPDGNGTDLLRQMHAWYPVTGIVLSGFGSAADLEDSKLAGFARHLTKPVDGDELCQAITDAMAARTKAPHIPAFDWWSEHHCGG